MMNKVKNTILGLTLVSTTLVAGNLDYSYDSNSLVGVEVGYGSIDYEFGTPLVNEQNKIGVPYGGLKVGAETDSYRVFLSGRYFYDSSKEYDYITAYGAEIQYKFNPSQAFDIFIGANAGMANLKWRSDTETFSRTLSTTYFGGDIGANIHLGKTMDWEIGGRFMSLDDTNLKDDKTYRINTIVSAYTSIIFKWKMD